MRHIARIVSKQLLLLAALSCAAGVAQAVTYYVATSGSDSNSGTSAGSPWQTISKVNSVAFAAGSVISFQGGQTFNGKIILDSSDPGSAANPIVITSYGAGRATIHGGSSGAFTAYNTAGIQVTQINFMGSGRVTNTDDGVLVYLDLAGQILDTITFDQVDVSGFGKNGLVIGSWNGASGFKNIRITNVSSHDNGNNGISTYAQQAYVHANVYVGHCQSYNNSGLPGASGNTGSGIVLGGVASGTIERSVAHDNGWLSTTLEGPAGIWTYDSSAVIIQYNESHHNRTGSNTDGDGFDLDLNSKNCVLQYNYAHDNDGAGFLMYHGPADNAHTGNVMRYNISQNDCRKLGYGALMIGGQVNNAEVYHNTVYLTPASGANAAAFYLYGNRTSNVHVRNNILQTTSGVSLVRAEGGSGLLFQGNDYFPSGGPFHIDWTGTPYTTFAAWQSATGQERVNSAAVGFTVDPQLSNAGGAPTLNDADQLASLTAYQLRATSPLIDKGLNLSAQFGMNPGPQDFYGTPIPVGAAVDVGAYEMTLETPVPARCDLNSDGLISAPDVQILTSAILNGSTPPSYDLKGDGQVNILDVQLLANVILGVTVCP